MSEYSAEIIRRRAVEAERSFCEALVGPNPWPQYYCPHCGGNVPSDPWCANKECVDATVRLRGEA